MKKFLLKMRILLTNISRVIMSFLFINLNFSFLNKVFGTTSMDNEFIFSKDIMCYDAGPQKEDMMCYFSGYCNTTDSNSNKFINFITSGKVFIVALPVVLIIALVSFIIIKRKKSKKRENREVDDLAEESDKK